MKARAESDVLPSRLQVAFQHFDLQTPEMSTATKSKALLLPKGTTWDAQMAVAE